MKVIKRDGRTELLDITKIQKYTSSAVKDLVGVSQSELEVDAKILFKDGITTEEIQQTLIKTAVDKIDIDTPNWTFVASRLFLYDLYHKVSGFTGYKHLRDYFEKGMNENKILKGFSNKYDLDLLNDYIKPERDLQFNYLGIKTLYDRYLLKDRDDKPIELPQHMFMAIAMFLAQNEKDCNSKAMEFYDVLSKFEVMVATPTLSNARTPRHQLSSCYVGSMPDNIEGIFDSYKEMALLSKYGGGIGYDVSKIRGLGSYIDNHKNVSGGVVPFLKITNDIAVAVDQLGCVAKDSYVIVLDYVKVKENGKIIDVKYYEPYRNKNYQYDYPFDDVIEQAFKYIPEHRGYSKEFISNVIKEHLLGVHKPRKEILDKLNISLDIYKRIINKFNNTKKELPKGFKLINGISDELDNEYAINEDGFVINVRKFTILKIRQDKKGYSLVCLGYHYKVHQLVYRVHQLVYRTFIGNISENKQIDHIDHNKTNNNYKNLQETSLFDNNSKSWDFNREQRIMKIKTSGYLNGKKLIGKRSKYKVEILDKVSKIVPLSKVSADNYILSFNIRTGKPEFKRVLKTHKVIVEPKDQIKIVYEDGNYIITSNWHPLCIKENNKYIYKRSDSVKVGDIGVGNNGDKKIISIDNNPNVSSEYLDLTVDRNNNYFCSTHNENGEFHLIHNTRRGAIAVYLEVWHTDVLDFIDLRKNSGEERRRAHDLFPALWICDLFMKRVQENGLWTLFDPYEVAILTDVYGDEFEAKYIEFEQRDDIHKEVMSAKDLWKKILTNYFESGLPFLGFKDNANRCNPNNHSGIIRSSNLCVSGDTKILTKEYGYIEIEKVSGQILECWNGKEWSKTSLFKTSESQEVLEVELNNGVKGKFTPYHKWVVVENYKEKIVETKDLKPDMKIVKFDLPNNIKHGNQVMKSPYANGLYTAEGTEIINKHGRKCIMHLYDKKIELKKHLECMTSFSKVTDISNCKRITVRLNPNEMYDKFFIPDISFRLQDRIKWLEGLLDGDGYASSHSIQISSTNETFIKELMLMLQELGVYSRIENFRDEGYYKLPKNDKTMEYQHYYCQKVYRLSIASKGINRLVDLGFSPKRLQVRKGNFNRSAIHFVKVKSITNNGEKVATYCGNEPKLHRLMFNGILTMNCTEIFQNTSPSNYSVAVHFEDSWIDYFEENDIVETDNGIEKKANKLTSLDSIDGRKIYAVEKIGAGGETAVCNLASINLSKVNTKEDIERVVPIAIRMLDNVIDLNFYPNLKVKYTNSRNRAIGLGVMGEAEMLAREQIEWGSDKHLNRIDEIMEYISFNAIDASSDLSKEKGNYLDYEGSNWSKGILPIDLANKNALELLDRPLSCDWNSLKDKVKSQGMRNGYLMAIAPTSSISILVGTTQTIEPIYKKKWLEENLSGMIPNVVPNLNLDTYNYYVSAYSLDQRDIIKVASIRQKWIDQGQSVNIFMEIDKASGKYLNDIYMLAWELGLKSTYYLRSQSPDVKDEAMDRSIECYNCQ